MLNDLVLLESENFKFVNRDVKKPYWELLRMISKVYHKNLTDNMESHENDREQYAIHLHETSNYQLNAHALVL